MEVERQPRPRRNLGSDTKYDVSVKGKHYPSHYTPKGEEKGEKRSRQEVARSCLRARVGRANLLPTKTVEGRKGTVWALLSWGSFLATFGEWEMLKMVM